MAWLRIDDRVRTHPKVAQAGPAASWLWLCGICYCREHLTDGWIPAQAVATLAMNLTSPKKHAARLVTVGLWEQEADGYRVHDFLDWNPAKAEVLSERNRERDKKRQQRQPEPVSPACPPNVPEGQIGDSRVRIRGGAGDAGLGSPTGSGSEVLALSEESARETTAVAVRKAAGLPRPLMGNHRRCVPGTWDACHRGLCVPPFLASQWLQQLGHGLQAEAELKALIQDTLAPLGDGPIGDDPVAFWKAAWQVRHGKVAPSTAPRFDKGSRALDAVEEAIREERMARGVPHV
jgi:hypothetical protein